MSRNHLFLNTMDKEENMFLLRKIVYGLEETPRVWNKIINIFIIKLGFTKCVYEHGVYVRKVSSRKLLTLCLYVNDLMIYEERKYEL